MATTNMSAAPMEQRTLQLNGSDSTGSRRSRVAEPTIKFRAPFKGIKGRKPSGSSHELGEMKTRAVEPQEAEIGGTPLKPDDVSSHRQGSPLIPDPDSASYAERSKPDDVPLQTPVSDALHNSSRVEVCTMSDASLGKGSHLRVHPHRAESPSPKSLFLPSEIADRSKVKASNSGSNDVASFKRQWKRIKKLRNEVWRLRLRIHEMRRDLKEKQLAKSTADDRYFQFVRTHGTHSNVYQDTKSIMAQLFHECEVARDIYGPLEDDCTLLENYLGSQEWELQRLEESFYSRKPELSKPDVLPTDVIDSPQPSATSSIRSELAIEKHPLLKQYFSRLGEVQILRERLDDLVEHRYILEEGHKTRARVGRELAPSDLEWLQNYSATEDRMMKELEIAKNESADLRQQCFDLGLIDEEGTPTDFDTKEQRTFALDDVDPGSETSEYTKFPQLIPRIEHEYDEGTAKSNDRISSWLLTRLRTSALEVKLLANIFEAACGKIEHGEKWQVDVLDFWFNDKTNNDLKPHNTSSGSYQTSHSVPFPKSLKSGRYSYRSWDIIVKSSYLRPSTFDSNPDSDPDSESDRTQKRVTPLRRPPTKNQVLSKSI